MTLDNDEYKHLCDFLSRAGGSLFNTTVTSKTRKRWLLNTGGKWFSNGEMYEVKFKNLGGGVYEVSCREPKVLT